MQLSHGTREHRQFASMSVIVHIDETPDHEGIGKIQAVSVFPFSVRDDNSLTGGTDPSTTSLQLFR